MAVLHDGAHARGTLGDVKARFSDPDRAAELVATLARAVHEGHQNGVVHRDLKPENIVFDEAGLGYVTDFGVAKLLDAEDGTATGVRVGTRGYWPPEQAGGHARHVTPAADVWSLGVILHELLEGRRPFAEVTHALELYRILEDEPDPIRRRDVRRDLVTICHACLQKDPARRYASALALAEDLERCVRREPIRVRRPGRLEQAARFCARHPASAGLLGVATVALVALTAWAFAVARSQEHARRAEVLAGNRYAARAVAGAVLHQLDEYAAAVAREARDEALRAALLGGDQAALQARCDKMRDRHAPVVYWAVIDRDGALRARAPQGPYASAYQIDYRFRDYYRGVRALRPEIEPAIYVSRAFRATTDGRYKIALTAPVRDATGEFLGLLIGELPTERRLGALELSDDRRLAVLAVRRDRERPDDPLPPEHLLLVHGNVEHGEGVPVKSAALDRLAARRDAAPGSPQLRMAPADWSETEDDYRDPLEARGPLGARGAWLAGVAPVGGTELAVIVQTRAEDATASDRSPLRVLAAWSVGGAALLVAGLLAALRSTRRRASAPVG